MPALEFKEVRGLEGLKEATLHLVPQNKKPEPGTEWRTPPNLDLAAICAAGKVRSPHLQHRPGHLKSRKLAGLN